MAGMYGKTPRTAKHGSCIGHPKLPCGCKVCETPQSTAHEDLPGLTSFHAYIHEVQTRHAARSRPRGTGKPVTLLNPYTGEEWAA